jgi:hypothetical protein
VAIPNPSDDIFNLNIATDWQLFSSDGKMLKTEFGKVVNLADYQTGFYILKSKEGILKLIKN